MDLFSVKQRFGIIGASEVMDRALEIAIRVAPTDLTVLVTGESGVGKEFFPQVIHAYSSRKHNKYIAVNCGAIPEGTIDSELFGHEKGSFTGAIESRKGYFEEANGGTIFLDEVAELPQSTQVRLLRVLQAGEYIRVGSSKTQKTDVRVVAATNVDLQKAVREGRFREDLYYRLNTVPIAVPPLRERIGDIYMLFRKFSSDVAVQYKMPAISLDEGARHELENYYWRGNIRQLKNVAEQISAIEESRLITAPILKRYLPDDGSQVRMPALVGGDQRDSGSGFERELLYKALFDMRNEISEIKRMLQDMAGGDKAAAETTERIAGLLQASTQRSDNPSYAMSSGADNVYAETVEIAEEGGKELTKDQVMREAIIRALKRHNGRRKEAAKDLFISERTLYRKIKELGIEDY